MHQDAAAQLLSSPAAEEWIRAAVTGDPVDRGTVRVELDRVHHRPDADTTAGFHVTTADEQGREIVEYVVATTADIPLDEGVVEVNRDGVVLRFWRHPADPRLPSLDDACDPLVVAGWLGVERAELDLVAYRPLRRAVVEAKAGPARYFIKVMSQDRARSQVERHQVIAEAGVGPEVVGEPAAGVMIIRGAAGEPLAERFAAVRHGGPPPDPRDVTQVLDRLPAALLDLPRRPAWSERLEFHAHAARVALPEFASEIDTLVREIQSIMAARPTGPVVPVHGDLYEANIFVTDDPKPRYTLIDLDTAGPGHRVDDLACVLAHLALLPDLSPTHYAGLIEVLENWRTHFETIVDPAALRARVAGVMLTLVAGTTRAHALARLDLVRSWVQRARS